MEKRGFKDTDPRIREGDLTGAAGGGIARHIKRVAPKTHVLSGEGQVTAIEGDFIGDDAIGAVG